MTKRKRARPQARESDRRLEAPFSVRFPPVMGAARGALWLATLLVLFVAPFPRGLYFPAEHLTAVIVLSALFCGSWILRVVRSDPPWQWQILDWAVLALLLSYVISLPVAANLRAAVGEVLKLSACLAVYWLVASQAGKGRRAALADVLVAAGAALVLLGLAAFTGLADVPAAVSHGRLSSALQYPNTLAAYLTALLFLALVRREALRPSAWRHLHSASAFLLMTGTLLALSRGATLILAPVAVVFLVALPPGLRVGLGMQLGVSLVAGALIAARIGGAGQGSALISGAWLLAGGMAAVAGGRVLEARWGIRAGWATAAASLLALVAWSSGALLRDLASTLGRLTAITLTDPNLLGRLVYYQDGLRIALTRPWLGAGGGAWEAMYHSVQAYPYFSASPHSFIIEHLLATGVVGLTLLALCWAAFVRQGFRAADQGPDRRLEAAGLIAAGVALGLHSLIDVTLGQLAVAMLLFSLFGLVRAMEDGGGSSPTGNRPQLAPAVAVAASMAVAIIAGLLLQGHVHGQRGIALLAEGRHEQARAAFEQARKADPLMGSFAMDLATCYEALAELRQDVRLLEQAREQMRVALRREPYHSFYHQRYGIVELARGRIGEGLFHLERSLQLFPSMAAYYGNLARAQVLVGLHDLAEGRRQDALARAQVVLKLEGEASTRAGLAPAYVVPEYRMAMPDVNLTLAAAQARVMLGRHEEAAEALVAIAHDRGLAEAYIWAAFALEGLGVDPGSSVAFPYDVDPDLIAEYERLKQLLGRSWAGSAD